MNILIIYTDRNEGIDLELPIQDTSIDVSNFVLPIIKEESEYLLMASIQKVQPNIVLVLSTKDEDDISFSKIAINRMEDGEVEEVISTTGENAYFTTFALTDIQKLVQGFVRPIAVNNTISMGRENYIFYKILDNVIKTQKDIYVGHLNFPIFKEEIHKSEKEKLEEIIQTIAQIHTI